MPVISFSKKWVLSGWISAPSAPDFPPNSRVGSHLLPPGSLGYPSLPLLPTGPREAQGPPRVTLGPCTHGRRLLQSWTDPLKDLTSQNNLPDVPHPMQQKPAAFLQGVLSSATCQGCQHFHGRGAGCRKACSRQVIDGTC